MSYYDKSSLVLIPSGTNTGKVFSQKPVSGDGDFTFTRASAATRVNADGNIEKETMNLWLYSNDISDHTLLNASVSSGQSDPFGGNNAWSWRETTANGQHYGRPQQAYNQVANTIYSVSFYVKPINKTTIYITTTNNNAGEFASCTFDFTTGTFTNQAVGVAGTFSEELTDGWWRVGYSYVVSVTGAYQIYYNNLSTYTGNTANGYNIYGFQLNKGVAPNSYIETTTTALYGGITDNTPRLDYTDSSCPALLLEPLRTNLVYQSEYYGAYAPTRVTLTSNYGISPEGVQNAAAIFNTTENGRHNLNGEYFAVTSGTSYVNSVFAKAGTITKMQLRLYSGGGISIGFNDGVFDLINGTATGTGAGIESYGNGWYRCYVVDSPTSSASNARFNIELLDDLGSVSYVGSVTDYIEIYGSDISAGSYATSYIPTYGSSVTRVGDAAIKTSASSLIGQTEGTIFLEFEADEDIPQNMNLINFNNSTQASVLIAKRLTGQIRAQVLAGGVSVFDINSVAVSGTTKVAFGYKSGDSVLYVNGVALSNSNTFTFNGTLSEVKFPANEAYFNYGHKYSVNQTMLFKTRLSNTDLEILTGTYYESYSAMAAALNYTVYE